jgi:hypothetical protein
MSDRPARPEWRAAYLDRTLDRTLGRQPPRGGARGTRTHAFAARQAALDARDPPAGRPRPRLDSLPLAITAMLHLVPST